MANISYRIGQQSSVENIKESIADYKDGVETLEKIRAHLAANDVDLAKTPIVNGPWLEFDGKKENFEKDWSYEANMYLSRLYRKPFVVPENV